MYKKHDRDDYACENVYTVNTHVIDMHNTY